MCVPCDATDAVDGPEWVTPPEMLDIHAQVVPDRIGVHILTGPVHVRGAQPGDALAVDILEVALLANWAWTIARPYGGALELTEGAHLRHTRLDGPKGVARPPWGGELDLRPFFGVLATSPPAEFGRQSSIPPRNEYGGNLDCKELVAGTTLYLPVHTDGAGFVCGDGHARQGDGECCGTALETCLAGAFRLSVIKPSARDGSGAAAPMRRRMGVKAPLARPRAESDDALISLACAMRVDEAAKLALEDMLDWLGERGRRWRGDAHPPVGRGRRARHAARQRRQPARMSFEKRFLPPSPRGPPPPQRPSTRRTAGNRRSGRARRVMTCARTYCRLRLYAHMQMNRVQRRPPRSYAGFIVSNNKSVSKVR